MRGVPNCYILPLIYQVLLSLQYHCNNCSSFEGTRSVISFLSRFFLPVNVGHSGRRVELGCHDLNRFEMAVQFLDWMHGFPDVLCHQRLPLDVRQVEDVVLAVLGA